MELVLFSESYRDSSEFIGKCESGRPECIMQLTDVRGCKSKACDVPAEVYMRHLRREIVRQGFDITVVGFDLQGLDHINVNFMKVVINFSFAKDMTLRYKSHIKRQRLEYQNIRSTE
ncbi:unnamed protein product [Clavelina lepadiformis]|uniref:Uncharacterized protein n=1 Tax=Clavelina lepadiformis TaxID=159417 RepID=A0ABP0G2P7_CLALP